MFLSFSTLSATENGSTRAYKASSEQSNLDAVIKNDLMFTPFTIYITVKAQVIRQ